MAVAYAEPDIPTRPSFSTARRKIPPLGISHVRQTLNPGVPVLPLSPASLDAGWAVAYMPRGRLAYRGSVFLMHDSLRQSCHLHLFTPSFHSPSRKNFDWQAGCISAPNGLL